MSHSLARGGRRKGDDPGVHCVVAPISGSDRTRHDHVPTVLDSHHPGVKRAVDVIEPGLLENQCSLPPMGRFAFGAVKRECRAGRRGRIDDEVMRICIVVSHDHRPADNRHHDLRREQVLPCRYRQPALQPGNVRYDGNPALTHRQLPPRALHDLIAGPHAADVRAEGIVVVVKSRATQSERHVSVAPEPESERSWGERGRPYEERCAQPIGKGDATPGYKD